MLSFPVPREMRTEFRFSEMRDKRLNFNETTHSRPSEGSIPVFSEITYALCSGLPCTTTALISVAQSETVLMYFCAGRTILCYFRSLWNVSCRPAVTKKQAGRRRRLKHVAKNNPTTARSGPTAGSVTPLRRLQLDPRRRSSVRGRACHTTQTTTTKSSTSLQMVGRTTSITGFKSAPAKVSK